MQVEIKAPSHPFVVGFHILFKVLALLTYLLGSLISGGSQFVLPFIFTCIFLALDFWVTKNVSGRLLVGLRWWNEVKEDGTNIWIFESLEKEALIHPVESKIFWIALLVFPVIWVAFLLKQLLTLTWNWAILCGLALALNAANVTGYIKCAREARKQLTEMATSFVVGEAIKNMTNTGNDSQKQ